MENEIIVRLCGRMANQMFEWAFARAYELYNGILPQIDNSQETLKLTHFSLMKNIKCVKKPFWYYILRKTIFIRNLRNKLTEIKFDYLPNYEEKTLFKYEPELFEIKAPAYIKGYFQSEKFFTQVRKTLIEDFSLKTKLNSKNSKMLERIKNTESIAIHFRRGDYLKARVANVYGGCSVDYYKNSVNFIAQKFDKKPTLFIFSDDIKWVKENVKFDYETIYVDINSAKQGYFDLELMKNCKHNVIANSSFSWWGAWLNESPEKLVVAPKVWMKTVENDYDLIPENWNRIEN